MTALRISVIIKVNYKDEAKFKEMAKGKHAGRNEEEKIIG